MNQRVAQIKKQQQIVDQSYSYETTGNVLSALEQYANKKGCKSNIFNAYDNFNCGSKKTDQQLKAQIISQLEVLKASHQMYRQQYGEYHFPKNLSKDQMITQINQWKKHVPPEDHRYYDAAITIINGGTPESFVHELGKDSKINPAFLAANVGIVHESRQVGERAWDNYKQKGIEPQMRMHEQYHGSDNLNKAGQRELQRRSENKKIDQLLDDLENILKQMEQTNDVQKYASNYNICSTEFIKEYENHIQQYGIYWYKNNQSVYEQKRKIIIKLCNGLGQGYLFNKLLDCLREY